MHGKSRGGIQVKNHENVKYTYCNPLSLPNIPRGKDDWYALENGMFSHENKPATVSGPDYRSISDPTVMYYDKKWYLYPSYGMAWVTEDFKDWKHVRTEPYCPKYSPAIIPWSGRFLMTSWNCPLYVSDNPLGPFKLLGDFIKPDGTTFVPCDPCLFSDDDGRIYMYSFDSEEQKGKDYFICRIVGWELDQEDPRRIIEGPVTVIEMDPHKKPWERQGFHNQNKNFGWIEGPHLLKHDGKYYLIYAAPDTCDPSYCLAVYVSDESPLTGFRCQKRNPLTTSRHGIVSGAGHGCVVQGPENTLWVFYTIAAPYYHRYERRIGMDLVAVDENGELYCPHGITDTPQFIPGFLSNPISNGNSPGFVSLTGWGRPVASSQKEGRDAIYATDESCLTWWEPEDDDLEPTLTCDLQGSFTVCAVRIFWRERGLDYQKGIVPGPMCYLLEGYTGSKWVALMDKRDNKEEKNIDYQVFDPTVCNKVRLTITKWPKGIHPGVIDFAVFGICV